MRRVLRWARHPRRHIDRPAGPANPFEALLLLACFVQGAAVVTGLARPAALEAVLPAWLRHVWGLLLLAGGGAAFAGLYWPWDPVDGILLKRIGLIALVGGSLAYGIVLLDLGPPGIVAGLGDVAFAAACAVRVRQVSIALSDFRSGVRTHNGAEPT